MSPVVLWSWFLTVAATANVVAWATVATALLRVPETADASERRLRHWQLLLSSGYVFGCAFRSLFPVFDVPRIALADSPLATALIGRSVASVAELCFIAQWALILRQFAKASGSRSVEVSAYALVPLILIAEVCSWTSVLTTSNLGHVFEESIWAAATAMILGALLFCQRRDDFPWRRQGNWLIAAGLCYLMYLVLVDIPMYWTRWIADEAANRPYYTLAQGWLNAAGPHLVSYDWDIWKTEMGWMSVYFTVAVWASLWLVRAPMPNRRPKLVTPPLHHRLRLLEQPTAVHR